MNDDVLGQIAATIRREAPGAEIEAAYTPADSSTAAPSEWRQALLVPPGTFSMLLYTPMVLDEAAAKQMPSDAIGTITYYERCLLADVLNDRHGDISSDRTPFPVWHKRLAQGRVQMTAGANPYFAHPLRRWVAPPQAYAKAIQYVGFLLAPPLTALMGVVPQEQAALDSPINMTQLAAAVGINDDLPITPQKLRDLYENSNETHKHTAIFIRHLVDETVAALWPVEQEFLLAGVENCESLQLADQGPPPPRHRFIKPERVALLGVKERIVEVKQTKKVSSPTTPAANDAEIAALREELVAERRLRERQDEQVRLLEQRLETEKDRARNKRSADRASDLIESLRQRVQHLEASRAGAAPVDPRQIETPETWDDFEAFVQEHIGKRAVISRAAIKEARQSPFTQISQCYESLLLLTHAYLPMLGGDPAAKALFDEWSRALRIEVSATGAAVESARLRESYGFTYLGARRYLDRHLSGSSSRDPAKCLRIYFSVIEDDGPQPYLYIGHFPTHKRNRLT